MNEGRDALKLASRAPHFAAPCLFLLLVFVPPQGRAATQETTVSGQVALQGTGEPVPGVAVRLTDEFLQSLAETVTDSRGRWTTAVENPASVSYLIVSGPGLPETLVEVEDVTTEIHVEIASPPRETAPDPAAGLGGGSGIFGFVTDEGSGGPIPDVLVRLERGGQALGSRVSSVGGFFQFDSLQPGMYRIQTEHLGFRPREAEVVLISGRATQALIPLSPRAIPLEGFEVSVRTTTLLRGLRDFERRRTFPAGEFFPREKLRDRGSAMLVDLLMGLPSIKLRRGEREGVTRVVARGRECTIGVWIDGRIQSPGFAQLSLDQLTAQDIEAVEVYKLDELPAEFFHPLSGCVTMIVWTKGR